MSETYDIIAISDRGVYAICSEEVSTDHLTEFVRDALAHGDRIERVTTGEAVRRHREYLSTLDSFKGLLSPSTVEAGE
jgi:hypothetical protein